MDPVTIAAAATALVVKYVKKAAGEAVEELSGDVGEAVTGKAKAIYEAIKRRFQPGSYEAQTVERAEQKPADEGRQASLQQVLQETMAGDAGFADTLATLVEEARRAGGESVVITVTGSGAGASHGGVAAGAGGIAAGGNVYTGPPRGDG